MKNIETLENRQDDWLARELEREKQISSFDFGEGKRLRQIHISHNHHVKRVDLYKRDDNGVSTRIIVGYVFIILFIVMLIKFLI